MFWLDQKYVSLLSGCLRNFKRKSDRLWNFSCPLCGDSEKNQYKARGYVYEKQGRAIFHCHNCGASRTFKNFLKEINEVLYIDYAKEELLEKHQQHAYVPVPKEEKKLSPTSPRGWLSKLKKISQLDPTHPAKMYIEGRKIPSRHHYRIYYVPKFYAFTNWLLPNKFNSFTEEPRILVPFVDAAGNVFGYQGRKFIGTDDDKRSKYYTIMLEERPSVWGMDTYKAADHGYALEGPFDAMFIDNAVASLGGTILRDLSNLKIPINKTTIIYDNERRSVDTVKKIRSSLRSGFSTCIWPDEVTEKDVNDMVLAGYREHGNLDLAMENVKRVIDRNTFRGDVGLVRLSEWSRT